MTNIFNHNRGFLILLFLCQPFLVCHAERNPDNKEKQALPHPLQHNANTLSNLGGLINLCPVILPSGNILFSGQLLGHGTYLCKLSGRDSVSGKLVYERPKKLDISLESPKLWINKDGGSNLVFKNKGCWHTGYFDESNPDSIRNLCPMLFGGKTLNSNDICITKIDGKIYLLTFEFTDKSSYWPNKKNPWIVPPNPDIGLGKSYDESGKWKGQKVEAKLMFAEITNARTNTFTTLFSVMNEDNTPFSLKGYFSYVNCASLDILGIENKQLLLCSDVDKFSLWNITEEKDNLKINALSLPEGLSTSISYFNVPMSSTVYIEDKKHEGFITGNNAGTIEEYRYINNEGWKGQNVLVKGGDVTVEALAVPQLCDWDYDGDNDIISGDSSGLLWFIENGGTKQEPRWLTPVKMKAGGKIIHHQAGHSGSLQGPNEKRWGYLQPLVTDWDKDGLLDIAVNDITGYHQIYYNIGSKNFPKLTQAVPLTENGQNFQGAWRSRPAVLKNKSGLDSYLALDKDGWICLYKRNGNDPDNLKEKQVLFSDRGEPVRIVGYAGHSGRATLDVCDYNEDGIWDIVFGQGIHMSQCKIASGAVGYSTAYVMINNGSNDQPCFSIPTPLCQKSGEAINLDRHGCWISPLLNKNNGIKAILCGGENGKFYFFDAPKLCNTF